MKFTLENISFDQVPLSKRDVAYLHSDPKISALLPFEDNLKGLQKKIKDRNRYPFFRKELVQTLYDQYTSLPHTNITSDAIDNLLSPNTFSVTTAHQPSLFTGPLYFIYKAASCINLALRLRNELPEYHFVPIFILGAEDHDFEEINQLPIYNKTITWNKKSTGPTGALSIAGISALIEQVNQLLPQTDHTVQLIQKLTDSFSKGRDYGQATQAFIHHLFGQYGLITLQMNAHTLKKLAISIFRKELFNQTSFPLVNQSLLKLKELGFKAQAKPREINLFYMTNQIRKRIVFAEGVYRVVDTDLVWTEKEISELLEKSPEKFSPNVITRPLYQELILPNIAYVGGGGELAYWQERVSQFEAFEVSYPVLIRRNSALWLGTHTQKMMAKLKLLPKDLFDTTKDILLKLDTEEVDLSIQKEVADLDKIYEALVQKANQINPDLKARILAEKSKQLKSIQQIGSKLTKAFKQKNETSIRKIEKLQIRLFPNGGLQERHDNFLSIYAEHGQDYLDFLINNFDPLNKAFIIVKA